MKKNTKPDYKIKIGKSLFYSDVQNHFIVDFTKVAASLVAQLPINIEFELKKPKIRIVRYIKDAEPEPPGLILTRINSSVTEICIIDEIHPDDWHGEISLEYYWDLQKEYINTIAKSQNLQFISVNNDFDQYEFRYKVKVNSLKIGEAFNEAIEIDNQIIDKMEQILEMGSRYMHQLAVSGIQSDVSKFTNRNKRINSNSGV